MTRSVTPPVCYGVDEGSQRSGMTLVLRMLPLVVHIRQERTLMTAGLNQVARMILTVAAEKGIEGVKPEDQHYDVRCTYRIRVVPGAWFDSVGSRCARGSR